MSVVKEKSSKSEIFMNCVTGRPAVVFFPSMAANNLKKIQSKYLMKLSDSPELAISFKFHFPSGIHKTVGSQTNERSFFDKDMTKVRES